MSDRFQACLLRDQAFYRKLFAILSSWHEQLSRFRHPEVFPASTGTRRDLAFALLHLLRRLLHMNFVLNEIEARVLGSLIEKDITTPDYYPLSLNALTNACNQKNNREPVMNLDEDSIRKALRTLNEKGLAGSAGGADSRVHKYEHRLQEAFNFGRPEIAVLCVLLLRGPQ